MPYCPQCGIQTEPEAVFCGACGTRLEEQVPPTPRCPPARLALRWSLLGRIVTLVALAVSGVVLYDAVANDGEWRESLFGGEEREAVVAAPSPTTEATVQPSETLEPVPSPEPTAVEEPTTMPPASGYTTPEEAISAFLQEYGLSYVGDCSTASLETDVGSYCSSLWEDRFDTRIYHAGLAFSEADTWLLLAQLSGREDWTVVDVAEVVPGPEWDLPPWR